MPADLAPLVLVVDDFADNRMLYAEYLRYAGFRVAEAADGPDAIAKATTLLPDAIVMDLALPIMDGWEATRRLRESASTASIPIVVLSGHDREIHTPRAEAAGFAAFFAKPCPPDMLVEKLKEIILAAKERELSASAEPRG
jgi:CheY-like chemotaxis protein